MLKNFLYILLIIAAITLILSCKSKPVSSDEPVKNIDPKKLKKATFAGGCFWCVESDFEKINGVVSAVSGYAGGKKKNPTYKMVSSGTTDYLESVQVTYDPDTISYSELLDRFWMIFDPTDPSGSFVDRGKQYTSAIFYHDEQQKKEAIASKTALYKSGKFRKPIVTVIRPLETFYPAEEYHQDYYKKNPIRYKFYRAGSGRDDFIEERWGKN